MKWLCYVFEFFVLFVLCCMCNEMVKMFMCV